MYKTYNTNMNTAIRFVKFYIMTQIKDLLSIILTIILLFLIKIYQ